MVVAVRFSVLGPVSVMTPAGLEPLGAPRQAGLLSVLLTRRGNNVRTHVLADNLWDVDPVTPSVVAFRDRERARIGL